jgi:poly-gamma-glutamate synthesis protein (capsule biosynthesis protein)
MPDRRKRQATPAGIARREALVLPVALAGAAVGCSVGSAASPDAGPAPEPGAPAATVILLGGDVMAGRGIDQVLPHPGDPRLPEPQRSALDHVELAERRNGLIPRPVHHAYVWGEALREMDHLAPDARVVNLETAVTTSDQAFPKPVNYRMHPRNAGCLAAAGIDCCALANNHALDWGRAGLAETLRTLAGVGIAVAGAGRDARQAEAPAAVGVPGKGRVLVFAFGTPSSGIPPGWAAGPAQPGVNLLSDLAYPTAARIGHRVRSWKRPGDVAIASIHWGGNWGYEVPVEHRAFARALVTEAGIDVVHGHSSHHPMAIEVFAGRPILYGCGDLLNDYEGRPHRRRAFRVDLVLLHAVTLERETGRLVCLELVPFRIRRFQLRRPGLVEADWLRRVLDREGERFGTWTEPADPRSRSWTLAWR